MIIAEVDFEEEDWSDVDGYGNVADQDVLAAAALGSTEFGLRITMDGDQDATYTYNTIDHDTDDLRFRFFFDPNGFQPTAAYIASVGLDGSHAGMFYGLHVRLFYSGGQYGVDILAFEDDDTSAGSADYQITDAAHVIEVHMQRESADGEADGVATLYVDGTQRAQITGLENYNLFDTISYMYLGAIEALSAHTGAYYVDELVVRDDNVEIGTTVYYTGNVSLSFKRKMPGLIFVRED